MIITQEASKVTLKATAVESSFTGTLNAEGTALAGTRIWVRSRRP